MCTLYVHAQSTYLLLIVLNADRADVLCKESFVQDIVRHVRAMIDIVISLNRCNHYIISLMGPGRVPGFPNHYLEFPNPGN